MGYLWFICTSITILITFERVKLFQTKFISLVKIIKPNTHHHKTKWKASSGDWGSGSCSEDTVASHNEEDSHHCYLHLDNSGRTLIQPIFIGRFN